MEVGNRSKGRLVELYSLRMLFSLTGWTDCYESNLLPTETRDKVMCQFLVSFISYTVGEIHHSSFCKISIRDMSSVTDQLN